MENLIIVGSGPAGLTAGLYAARAGLKPLVLEGLESGGQLMQTQHVANYPGVTGTVPGSAIIKAMREQAEQAGVRFAYDEVKSVDFSGTTRKLITLMGDTLEARAVIIASGAGVTKTNLPGEAKYWGRGISACLTCDAAFYTGKKVVLVGEGPAVRGATSYLSSLKVDVVGAMRPADIKAFEGDGSHLTGLALTMGFMAPPKGVLPCDGVFLMTERAPQTKFLGGALACDPAGHIVVDGTKTSVPGVFAAGDCTRVHHKQAIVAAGDGAVAAMEAISFLSKNKG